jgi:hypothetical protein
MVEVTSKPTDISKIQDILNAINMGNDSDKNVMKVDYAKGSNLESNILALKGVAIQQAGYLKKMVEYQDKMLSTAKTESVSNTATNTTFDENRKGVLTSAGSAALTSVLGPLGPIVGLLGQLPSLLGLAGTGAAAAAATAAANKMNKTADESSTGATSTKPKLRPKYLTVDERLAAIAEDKRLAELTNQSQSTKPRLPTKYLTVDERLAAIAEDRRLAELANQRQIPPNQKLPIKYLTVDERLAAMDNKPLTLKPLPAINAGPEPFRLTQDMRVAPKIPDVPTTGAAAPIKGSKVPGALGALLSGGMGYFDEELKDAGLTGIQRVGQGLLESIPSAIDFAVESLITNILNTGRNFGPEEDKFDFSITPAFRRFMLRMGSTEVRQETNSDMNAILRQSMYDPMNPDRDRQRISPNAPHLQVPDKTGTQPQAPIIIAPPPSAPASSIVNSNNQQTTIINQTKDVSASLYTQMLGAN